MNWNVKAKKVDPRIWTKLDYRYSRVLGVGLPATFASILCLFCFAYQLIPGPEILILFFLVYAGYNKWTQRFAKDWVPFLASFLSYEAVGEIVHRMAGHVHVIEPMIADMRLFGSLPTSFLQEFYRLPILDYIGAVFYSLHFIAPVFFAFLLWKYHPDNYWKYTLALAIGTYAALLTFLLYPVAPPWYGVDATRVLMQVDHDIGLPFYGTIFNLIQANPFAAFPSLHAMYPWLISLFALKIQKAKALPILIFPFGVWFSAVYLGEHYVIDLVGGVVYATAAFLCVERLFPIVSRHLRRK